MQNSIDNFEKGILKKGLDSSLVEKPIGNEENVYKFNAKLN